MPEHVADDELELYSRDRLVGPDLERVEEHLLVCECCRVRLRRIDRFRAGLRAAFQHLQTVPLDITHDTEDGPIRLHVTKAEDGSFRATIAGQQLEAGRGFATVAEANGAVLKMFRQVFPEHECDERCGPLLLLEVRKC